MYHPEKVTPAVIEFVDIAGLVRGASKGEGLGNKFLSHIREVDAIVHVVRCFENDNITHVDGSIDPLRDMETINLELILSDLELCEKRIDKAKKLLKGLSLIHICTDYPGFLRPGDPGDAGGVHSDRLVQHHAADQKSDPLSETGDLCGELPCERYPQVLHHV